MGRRAGQVGRGAVVELRARARPCGCPARAGHRDDRRRHHDLPGGDGHRGAYNLAGISNDWQAQTRELFVGRENNPFARPRHQHSSSAQALAEVGVTPGPRISRGGIEFSWPKSEDGEPNVVLARGQAIRVNGTGERLGFLLAGLAPVTGTGTIVYADGTHQQYEVTAGAWGERTAGAEVAIEAPYRTDALVPGS
jgi:hypothetical protein